MEEGLIVLIPLHDGKGRIVYTHSLTWWKREDCLYSFPHMMEEGLIVLIPLHDGKGRIVYTHSLTWWKREDCLYSFPHMMEEGLIVLIPLHDRKGRIVYTHSLTWWKREDCLYSFPYMMEERGLLFPYMMEERGLFVEMDYKSLFQNVRYANATSTSLIAQVRILSATLALFIITIDLVLYRLSPLFFLIRSSHRPVVH
ncbi:hypothetical protein J6590_043233 [Homalodisca vitripennis]|nr:hypothetical protein J6590_043233 [Homalodisca vitripennis]